MENINTPASPNPKLLDQVRDRIRIKHYSIRTETQYLQWVSEVIGALPKSRRRDTRSLCCGKLECGAAEDRCSKGACCPRVSMVMGEVIGRGESA